MIPVLVFVAATSGGLPTYHISHLRKFGFGLPEPNRAVLHGVDIVQATAPDGGGYFIGVKADPPESPIGYKVSLFDKPLLQPPRCTSYCSGASYSAFVTALDLLLGSEVKVSEEVQEAVRMQEPDGGRREDMVKLYGWWNADGPGSFYALCGYSQMGVRVRPEDALPGDFVNINWVKGPGHSVVFLGWEPTQEGQPGMRFWSSQSSTNGLGDKTVALSSISGFVFTRLTAPANLAKLDPALIMERPKVVYDVPKLAAPNGDPTTKTLRKL
jgi:hypothetical protein